VIAAALFQPFAEAYAAHVGSPARGDELRRELERRLGALPPWARASMALCAVWARWLSPLLILRRARPFERLSAEEREELLGRLQRDRRLAVRALFLGAKTVTLGACYGRADFLATLGYGA
jgi:hypothetical protein